MATKKKALLAAAGAGGGDGLGTFIRRFDNALYETLNGNRTPPYYDSEGNVYVAFHDTGYYGGLFIASYDVDNDIRWARRIRMTFNSNYRELQPASMWVDEDNDRINLLTNYGSQAVAIRVKASDGTAISNGRHYSGDLEYNYTRGAVATTNGYHVRGGATNNTGNYFGINVYPHSGGTPFRRRVYWSMTNYGTVMDDHKPKVDEDNNIYLPWDTTDQRWLFITKFDSSFNHEWTLRFYDGATGTQSLRNIAVSSETSSLYSVSNHSFETYRSKVVKWDTDGTYITAKRIGWIDSSGTAQHDEVQAHSISIGRDGYVYVGGSISNEISYDGNSGRPAFVLKLDPDDLSLVDHFMVAPDGENNYNASPWIMGSPSYPNLQAQLNFISGNQPYSIVLDGSFPTSFPTTACGYNLFKDTDINANCQLSVSAESVSSSIVTTSAAQSSNLTYEDSSTVVVTNVDLIQSVESTLGCKTDLA
jgi:hypothetical protein